MTDAIEEQDCKIIYVSPENRAPFRITFETGTGERMGIVAYAFTANSRLTKNRPSDEHRFQIKYGSKGDGRYHQLWQDPYGLYTTLLVGINPELGIFVGADPVLHNPTKFFISLEFKEADAQTIAANGWHAWEREQRSRSDSEPIEVFVGGTRQSFVRYIRFEREALGEDQGHRQLLAEQSAPDSPKEIMLPGEIPPAVEAARLHSLAREFALTETEVLDLIASARRLKMAVRGWVAEKHLVRQLTSIDGVSDCRQLDDEGKPDVELRFEGSRILTIECKNVLRQRAADGSPRLDFQRTRASKSDPCSRYYSPFDFDVIAACLHAVTERWEFSYTLPGRLSPHKTCTAKLASTVRVDQRWALDVVDVLRAAAP